MWRWMGSTRWYDSEALRVNESTKILAFFGIKHRKQGTEIQRATTLEITLFKNRSVPGFERQEVIAEQNLGKLAFSLKLPALKQILTKRLICV